MYKLKLHLSLCENVKCAIVIKFHVILHLKVFFFFSSRCQQSSTKPLILNPGPGEPPTLHILGFPKSSTPDSTH